ncbi:MAG: DUF2383 domain-containing protein [Shimia sp.]
MAQRLNNLNEIISTLRTGANYYRKAARQTNKSDRDQLFREHAKWREHHAKTLADIIEDVGGEVKDVNPTEKAWELIGRLFAFTGQTDRQLIMGLEEHEDRTQEKFRKVMQHPDNQRDLDILEPMAEDFRTAHQRMRELKSNFTDTKQKRHDTGAGKTEALDDQPAALKSAPPTPADPKRADKRSMETSETPETPQTDDAPEMSEAPDASGATGASQAEAKPKPNTAKAA